MSSPIRLTVVMTHPIQYYSPWFRFIASEVKELALSVVYVCEPSPSQQGAQFGTEFSWDIPLRDGYESIVLRDARPGDDFGSARFFGLDAPGLGSAIEASRPDAVLLSGWHSVSLVRALLWCRRRRIPLLYRGDTHLGDREPSIAWRARTRFLLSRFDAFLSVGVRVRAYLRSFGVSASRIYESPHAVDNEFFERSARAFREPAARVEARRALDISGDAFVVLFAGKLEERKSPRDVIEAVATMTSPMVVVVAGGGAMEPECRDLAAELGVDARFCGFLNQSEIGRMYAISDCLALPSRSETWGLVVNEAMAAGLPCVVSDRVGCAPDLVVDGRTGETFPFGDCKELAGAIERVRGGVDRADACREHVKGYTFETATEGLVAACHHVSEAVR